ncbi:MAG: ABC transporter substrate-binding protein [Chloroflexi bacterium]|nr:ABC transporter substrate-binding protein [Chloroflexota bacterium]
MKYITLLSMMFSLLTIAACAPTATPKPVAAPLTDVTLVMGYIPNVQYAPFFVAEDKGYFAQEGIKVNYNWGFEFDGIKLVGANQADFAIVTGDQIIQARAQNVPIVYIGNWYNAFPIAVVSLADKNIKTPQDLVGKKVGLPGLFGASYTAWRALLYTSGIPEQDVRVENIGFTQVQALNQGTVDAAVAYANNEPVQLQLAGKSVNAIKTWEYAKLVGNGIATNEATLKNRPQLARGFVRALLRGIQDTLDNPDAALQITVKHVPEAGGENLATSKAVLQASLPLWQNTHLGETRLADWQAMEKFMRDAKFITTNVDVTKAFTNDLLE